MIKETTLDAYRQTLELLRFRFPELSFSIYMDNVGTVNGNAFFIVCSVTKGFKSKEIRTPPIISDDSTVWYWINFARNMDFNKFFENTEKV